MVAPKLGLADLSTVDLRDSHTTGASQRTMGKLGDGGP
jgi:hypothetical protein